MSDSIKIIRERQKAIRRAMNSRGIALKAVSIDSKIGYGTLQSYFPGDANKEPVQIPMSAVFCLIEGKALPLDLIALLLPANFIVVESLDEFDPEQASVDCHDFLVEKCRAHHPDSEAGPAIGPKERERLRLLHGKLAA